MTLSVPLASNACQWEAPIRVASTGRLRLPLAHDPGLIRLRFDRYRQVQTGAGVQGVQADAGVT
jgi:hypothetical protein